MRLSFITVLYAFVLLGMVHYFLVVSRIWYLYGYVIVYSNVISDFTYYFLVVSVYAAMAKQHDPRS